MEGECVRLGRWVGVEGKEGVKGECVSWLTNENFGIISPCMAIKEETHMSL